MDAGSHGSHKVGPDHPGHGRPRRRAARATWRSRALHPRGDATLTLRSAALAVGRLLEHVDDIDGAGDSAYLHRDAAAGVSTIVPWEIHGRMRAPAAARILVVDDEENIRHLVGSALRRAGFEITTAGSGRAALDLATTVRPDLVVLDIMLPDLDGFAVLAGLRRAGIEAPVIFLTARDATDDRVRGLTTGGADYQVKPFAVAELVARVRLRLEPGAGATAARLRHADLELDPDAHRATRAGAPLHLSPTEYRLLHYLLLNRGRVLTREQILVHVWNHDFEGEASVVDTYISYLRRKVDVREPRLIHTVRGVGFALRSDP